MIRYRPDEFLKKIAPPRKIEKLVKGNLTLNRAVLSFLDDADFLSKKTIERTALNTIKQYKSKFEDLKDEGASSADAKEEATNENKLLINRVQNSIVNQVAVEIKDQYEGEYYTWTPSNAAEPDPIHQLNYGKRFRIGVGEMPGDRYGCQCGMDIHVKEDKLDL